MLEEHGVIVNFLLLSKVAPNLVTKQKNGLDDLFLPERIVLVILVIFAHRELQLRFSVVHFGGVLLHLLLFLS